MKYFLSLFLFCSSVYAGGYQAGQESEHFPAEFWQRADGKYCVKLIQFENPDDPRNCVFVFDELHLSEDYPVRLEDFLSPQ